MSEFVHDVIPDAVEIKRYSRGVAVGSPNSVRVYRCSPDRVMLQIRGDKSFASVSLPFDAASEIAAALLNRGRAK